MRYFLSEGSVLKWLETPCVYNTITDELYELDEDSFNFLKKCASPDGCYPDDREFLEYCVREGLLTGKRNHFRHPSLIKSPEPSLRYLELQINNKCNLKCRHCYIEESAIKELSMEQIRDILNEFEAMQGLRVLITGGEPLLHPRFNEINDMLHDYLFRKVLFTNGLFLKKEILKTLNVNEIQISLDGLEDAHDAIRGKGTFRHALEAVRLSVEHGFDVSVSTMIHPMNLQDFDEMERFLENIGVKEWSVDIPCVAGRLKENTEYQVSPQEAGMYLRYGYGTGMHGTEPGFSCGLHLVSVMADGKIAKCTFYADSAAGTIKEGLLSCWNKIRTPRLTDLECDCAYIESCRGGCRYRAELSGNSFGKDLYRCALYGLLPDD